MKLYHGSNLAIDEIDLSKSKPFKDFGKGFYLSDIESQAQEMAQFKVSLFDGDPMVTAFEFDKEAMLRTNLKVLFFENYSEEWLDFVISNRERKATEHYDFVYGPIANDKVGLQLRKYKDGSINKQELMDRLKYMKGITFQYFFGSDEAIKFLTRL